MKLTTPIGSSQLARKVGHLCLALLLFASNTVAALKLEDAGSCAIISAAGNASTFVFYGSFSDGNWHVERRNTDLSWMDVSCGEHCELQPSGASDFSRFFPPTVLAEIPPSCVHNMAFAFCNYTFCTKPDGKRYFLVALVTRTPTLIGVTKLSNERLGR
jgi:hypothetical protein